jgi:GNAT superfamily N-acetyltransferase
MPEPEVKALTVATWPDFAAIWQRKSGLFSGCWCIHFHLGLDRPDEDNRGFKERMVAEGVAHAALVYVDGQAVAWAEYGTPEELPNIHHRKQYDAETDALPDYRITCVYVDQEHRRSGLGRVALKGAVDLIARAGGGVVEGYPRDYTDRDPAKKINPSFIYNLTRHTYEEAGFTYVRPKGQGNCVMSRTVAPTSSG